ncbi:MAG TPA: preprotein translocase subunit SecE [Solirubrobacteraceae bacterium]|nr:preprotein translocase subunit SecE [Solirubrobacteraceae bacterium]
MARDRKRARQRRSRPIREGASAPSQNRPVRADLPGSLDHTGDVDEFDAALVRGAGGVPVEEQVDLDRNGQGAREATPSELVPAAGGGRGGRLGDGAGATEEAFGEGAPSEGAAPTRRPSQPLRVRAIAFLRASWAELQRVQWPDRRHVTQATTVVLGFLVVAGVYLGAADWAAQQIVNFVL